MYICIYVYLYICIYVYIMMKNSVILKQKIFTPLDVVIVARESTPPHQSSRRLDGFAAAGLGHSANKMSTPMAQNVGPTFLRNALIPLDKLCTHPQFSGWREYEQSRVDELQEAFAERGEFGMTVTCNVQV